MTVKEAARRLSVSPATVYSLCAARRIRHARVGLGRGKIVILDDALEEFLKRQTVYVKVDEGPKPQAPTPTPSKLKRLVFP